MNALAHRSSDERNQRRRRARGAEKIEEAAEESLRGLEIMSPNILSYFNYLFLLNILFLRIFGSTVLYAPFQVFLLILSRNDRVEP